MYFHLHEVNTLYVEQNIHTLIYMVKMGIKVPTNFTVS